MENENANRIAELNQVITGIMKHDDLVDGNIEKILPFIVRKVSTAIDVERVSIWRFTPDETEIQCIAGYKKSTDEHFAGERIRIKNYPSYLKAVGDDKILVVEDVRKDERTEEMYRGYWEPKGVVSTLDAQIRIHGKLIGILCCKHVGSIRKWKPCEVNFVSQIADLISQAFLNCELKTLINSVRKQSEIMQRILNSLPEGIIVIDQDKRVIMVNKTGREYLPRLTNVGVGSKVSKIGRFPIDKVLELKPGIPLEVSVEKPFKLFEIFVYPLQEEGYLLVLKDITYSREIQMKTELQNRLASIGALSAGIAHDFNNILMSIMGFAEIIKYEESLSPVAMGHLSGIITQSKKASKLIRQILDFGRRTVIEPRPVDMVSFIKEMIEVFKRTLPENISYKFNYEPGTYWINADPAQIQQVLLNLATNSRDAMPEGGRITIGLEKFKLKEGDYPHCPGMKPGEWIKTIFQDTGTGIPEDVMPKIFDPFFTTKQRNEGTGLGLSQVYGIISQHGGFIDVESRTGEGTKFIIYFPCFKPEKLKEDKLDKLAEEEKIRSVGILLIEDEHSVKEVTRRMLERMGHRVFTASDGREALHIFEKNKDEIEIILSDMVLPDIKGIDIFKILKQKNSRIKFLIMTGYPVGAEHEISKSEISGWIQKPVEFAELKKLIKRTVEGK